MLKTNIDAVFSLGKGLGPVHKSTGPIEILTYVQLLYTYNNLVLLCARPSCSLFFVYTNNPCPRENVVLSCTSFFLIFVSIAMCIWVVDHRWLFHYSVKDGLKLNRETNRKNRRYPLSWLFTWQKRFIPCLGWLPLPPYHYLEIYVANNNGACGGNFVDAIMKMDWGTTPCACHSNSVGPNTRVSSIFTALWPAIINSRSRVMSKRNPLI